MWVIAAHRQDYEREALGQHSIYTLLALAIWVYMIYELQLVSTEKGDNLC